MNAVRRESTVTAVSGISKIPREEWNALVDDEVSPFLDWDWLHAMEASKSALPATGWAPRVGVREGVERLYEWLQESRPGVRRRALAGREAP